MAKVIKPNKVSEHNAMYIFEKSVELPCESEFTVKIYSTQRYTLYINGSYVCEGPCKGSENTRYYDEVKAQFKAGTNSIRIKVLRCTERFFIATKESTPAVIFEASDGKNTIISDEAWNCKLVSDHGFLYSKQVFLPPYESIKSYSKETDVGLIAEWDCAFEEDGAFSPFGVALPYPIIKRPIPMIYPGEETVLKPIKAGETFVDFDAGQYMTAKMKFHFNAPGKVKIIYSECYEFKDGKKVRDDTNGFLDGFFDEVENTDADFTYEPFWFKAFRFIRIEGDFESVENIKAYRFNYPFKIKGSFECSDESYNKMVDVSINTIKCCSHETLFDCPYYEQQQYEMDSAIETMVISRLTDDRRLTKKVILDFSESQNTNGLLCSVAPRTFTQIIPSFSLYWIIMLRDYLEYSKDTAFVSDFVGNMDKIIHYFQKQIEEKGYITNTKYWDFVDWVPSWVRGTAPLEENEAHTIYNLLYLKALRDASFICEKLGRNGLSGEYKSYYNTLSKTVVSLCYDEKRGMFRDGSKTEGYSMHTIIWAILSDVLPKDVQQKLITHIYDEGLAKSTFSMNFYLFRAFEKCERYDLAFDLFNKWEKMLDLHCTTWCENPDSTRSECHAWSSAPYYEFSANILGIKLGFENEITIAPNIGSLTYAKGNVPTRFGIVSVDWKRENGKFIIEFFGAEGIRKTVILPNGEKKTFIEGNFKAEQTL